MTESRSMWRWTRFAYFLLWVATFVALAIGYYVSAHAQAVPMPRTGSCPSGYTQSGGFCTPMANTRCRSIPKPERGQCPSGYSQSGNYCLEMGRCQR